MVHSLWFERLDCKYPETGSFLQKKSRSFRNGFVIEWNGKLYAFKHLLIDGYTQGLCDA